MGKQLVYQISLGETPAFYEVCIASVAAYCQRLGFDHIVQREPILKIRPVKSARSENALRLGYLPIYEKEQAFAYLDQYDQICILDADVYVKPDAPNIFTQTDATFAGVLERDMPLTPAYLDKIQKYSKGQYSTLTDVSWDWNERGAAFFNMGVMVVSNALRDYLNGQNPRQFIQRPEFERFVNGEGHWKWSTDQTLLNYWVKQSGMATKNLDWRWNALYGGVRSIEGAYFVHFFLAAKLPRKGAEIPSIIKSL